MTRRGSRTEGRTPELGRPAAAYTTNAPPPDAPILTCACGGKYRAYPESEAAHRTVFGHNPIRKSAPEGSAPELNKEGER